MQDKYRFAQQQKLDEMNGEKKIVINASPSAAAAAV